MFKCELLIGGQTYDVTNDLKNWDDFELLQKRPAYDGVVRSFSTQFEFVKNAYKLLKNEFYTNYLNAEATVIFSLRNNSWEYDEVFRCALDFSTYSEDGLIAYINAIDNTLAAIIKAKKNIQYEYPVADLSVKSLNYDRLEFIGRVTYYCGGRTLENGSILVDAVSGGDHYMTIPMYVGSNEMVPGSGIEVKDVGASGNLESCLIYTEKATSVKISIKGSYSWDGASLSADMQLKTKSGTLLKRWEGGWGGESISVNWDGEVALSANDGIVLLAAYNTKFALYYFSSLEINIDFPSIGKPVNIDVVSPVNLLNNLINSMSEGNTEYKGYFNYGMSDGGRNLKLERAYIMAAESARGLPKAKIYTSYKKFCDWMEAEFGYVPVISGNEVTFTHRDKLFTNTVVKELGKKINDYELMVNEGIVYSSVKVGYDKQDYDSINGRDEFRFTNEFSTGLKLLDNTLSLISPYRADAYGIEFLVQKRGEDTTDNSSDNDVFFVDCVKNPSTGTLDLHRPYSAAQLSGLLSPETMFNLGYSPRFMLEANKKYIGACTNLLKFASSDGNSDVSINGVKETDDLPIPERLFTVSEVEVSTSDIKAPDELTGLVSFNNKGEIITGYIKQLELNIAKEKAATYTLIVKDIKS